MIEKSYSLASGTLATQQIGNPKTTATTVVFIHGWLDNSASFSSVISNLQVLSPNSHLVAIDLFGHGFSSHKSGSYYPFHDYIDDLHQLVTKLSPNRLVLVGHSLGALIASCYSAAFPEKVSGLIQIEGHGPLSEAPHETVSRLREGVLSRLRQRRKPSRPLASLEDAIKLRVHANQIKAELIAPIVERGIAEFENSWQWRCDPNLKCDSLYRMSQTHAEVIMAAIECPQLIVLGNDGFRHLQHNRYKSAHSSLHIETIPGGHHCHLESPELVSELILGVVNKI
ncbi:MULTISPECIES: alpha/beta fold hydrolase [Vibrio]|jgi:pimeloyl-ACP methyl ester carboxylesterase|uniref:Hydrolase n=4 Tax=Vibrio TaxID=662 RepID=A0A7Z1ML81_9VIBR|nr:MULTISPECIES: alpha/beta hydrolase [Vibrio]KNH14296.1 hydrolase [Vibrio lentus]MBY7662655.1 alpha/beta hydrolase [Vibrio atlanticus]ERM60243.1 putative hydrolase/acyltransferase [Vibrio cyclitrophicus FF75]KAA8602134.1 putative hydrolase/acyltransferase [Vibrio cyclitrophicus]MBE8556738.1 alpha/beta hydrolase [Vibrio sp. OPT24]